MSVLIKGIHIPTGCAVCFYNRYTRCLLLPGSGFDETNGAQRRENCPIVELPDHGDLVDRDVLRKVMRVSASCNRCERDAYKCEYYDGMTAADVCEKIDDVPVVIPAERSVKVCPLSSDDEVTEYCVEGPCTDEMEGRCPIAERSEDGKA